MTNPLLLLRALFPRLAFGQAARKALREGVAPDAAAAIWHATQAHRALLVPLRPRHSFGVNRVLRYLEWDCALYRAALAQGLTREQAGSLIETVNWNIFGPLMNLSFTLSRLRSTRTGVRLKWALDFLFATVFTAPFQRRVLPDTQGLAFDVTLCPFADYFRACGAPELTRYAVCSLDHRMARDWGVGFERRGTLADGAPLCDFRFRVER